MIRFLGKYWKVILSILLILIAAYVYVFLTRPAIAAYEMQKASLEQQIAVLQQQVIDNAQYANVDLEKVQKAEDELLASRMQLYRKFPQEIRPEDQIIYIVWLEENFGTEIEFEFGSAEPIAYLSDGSVLGGVRLTVNFDSTYQGYKDMIATLTTDERIASVESSAIQYNPETKRIQGVLTIVHYLLVSPDLEYYSPNLIDPPAGKNDLFN